RAEPPHPQLRDGPDASGAEAPPPRARRRVLNAARRCAMTFFARSRESSADGRPVSLRTASVCSPRAAACARRRAGDRTGCARRKDVLERAADLIRRATGADLLAVTCDVTRPDQIEAFVAATVARWGGVDILVNNAGTSAAAGFEEVDDATWQTDIDLKLMAAIRLCRLVIPHMKRRGGGRIVNVTTVGGKAPAARALPTSVTRAAGINLTKSLANEYAADRILVNTICLGVVKS